MQVYPKSKPPCLPSCSGLAFIFWLHLGSSLPLREPIISHYIRRAILAHSKLFTLPKFGASSHPFRAYLPIYWANGPFPLQTRGKSAPMIFSATTPWSSKPITLYGSNVSDVMVISSCVGRHFNLIFTSATITPVPLISKW